MLRKLWDRINDSDWYFRLFKRSRPRYRVIGACKQTGNCCRNLILVNWGKSVHTLEDFERLKRKDKTYEMFEPREAPAADGFLRFTCRNLKNDNTCGIYDARPQMCRNYPNADIMMKAGGSLLPGCGYQIVPLKTFEEVLDKER